jgi:hypothetical protein
MKNKLNSTKNFVSTHRVALAVTATALTCTALTLRIQAVNTQFLKENDMLDAYDAWLSA